MKKATINILLYFFFFFLWTGSLYFWWVITRSEIAGSWGKAYPYEKCQRSSPVWSSIAVPLPAMEECSRFSQASEHLLCRVVKSAGKSSTSVSEAVSHCGFNLHFPMADDGEYLFMWSLAICIPSFVKYSSQGEMDFLFWEFVFAILNCLFYYCLIWVL